MTESEAKTKRCPIFVIANSLNNITATMLKSQGFPAEKCSEVAGWVHENCSGSDCPMWRSERKGRFMHPKDPAQPPHIPDIEYSSVGGYCGLAGK